MGIDLDNIDDDIFSDVVAKNNVKAAGRFQPRGKRGPVKKQPAAPTIVVPKEDSSNPHEDKCTELPNPLKQVTNQERVNRLSESLDESNVLVTGQHTVESLSESNVPVTEQHSRLVKSPGEKTDIACPQYKTEAPVIPVSQSRENGFVAEVVSFSSESTFILSKRVDDLARPESSSVQDPLAGRPQSPLNEDPLTGGHPIISVREGGSLMHDERSKSEQIEPDPFLESLDISDLTSNGPRTGKFQPKAKRHQARSKGSTPNPAVGLSGVRENEHLDHCEVQNPTSKCPEDDLLDLSALGFNHSVPSEPAFQPVQDMSVDASPHEGDTEAVCNMHKRMGALEANANQPSTSTSSQRSRPLRKCNNGRQLVDEAEDEEPNELSADPGELGDKEIQVDNKTQEKKVRKRSKKSVVEKEKPVRKHKKAGEVTDPKTGTVSKKFPHSTRPKKRRVDQTLLETPEDEIECQKVPLRDLIILAEYKERMTKKAATTSKVPSTGQSTGSTSTHHNDYEEIPSENVEAAEEPLFNYQTYMTKTARIRWSKQDTELFYQAMQQFGTDLSMIQQLFPGRTRNQIKLKYKREERQHPLRLREALTNRPNDFSHFQNVIEQLQKAAADNKPTESRDESFDLGDDAEAEQMSETIDEAVKPEQQVEKEEANDLPAEVPVKSPPLSYESEDDFEFDFSQYNSEV